MPAEVAEIVVEEPRVYTVAEWNLPIITNKISKLNQKALKYNCALIEVNILDTRSIVDPEHQDRVASEGAENLPHITVYDITIVGEGPKIAGWKFVGTMDHFTFPGQVVIQTVPGEVVPPQYFHSDGACDHCNKIRTRKETFVVENEDGTHKQVGRQCLKDFLGVDPQRIAWYLTSLYKFVSELTEEACMGGGGSREIYYDHDRLLQVTAAIIERKGWVAKSAANEDNQPTSSLVMYYFNRPWVAKEIPFWEEFKASLDADNPKYAEETIKAREWLKTQTQANEYMHNLHLIDEADRVPSKMVGYWVSVMAAYHRDQDRLNAIEYEKKANLNEYYGVIKERKEMEITVVKKRYFDGQWGTTTMVTMRTTEGNTIIWFANTDVQMDKGEKYKVKATISDHSEYNEWKQTKVKRLAIIEKVEDDKTE